MQNFPFVKQTARLLVMGGILLAGPAFVETAQAQNFLLEANQFEGKTVRSVVIRYRGAKTVAEARLRTHMAVAAGKKYSQTVLDEDIRTLYSSGLVDDVKFYAKNVADGVEVTAEVVTRRLIAGLGFAGNSKFTDRKLANESGLGVGQILSDEQIIQARQKIEKLYLDYGYPDIEVKHDLQPTARPGYADLVFVLNEGYKNEIRNIRFEGNSAFKDADLRKEMSTKQKGFFSWFTKSGRLNAVALDEDLERVADYYRSRGYWKVRVGIPKRLPVVNERVDLIIPVNEGAKYTVNSVNFPNLTVFTPEELMPALTLIQEMPFSSKKVRDDIRMIRDYFGSRGYADAAVVPDVREVSGSRVNIFYRVTRGKIFKVGRVNIQGNVKSEDRVIRREVAEGMRPGENFNSVDLESTKRRLRNLNYFSDVQVSSANSSQSGYRDVNILVSETNTGSVNFGVGFSSVDNIVGFVNLEQTNFDITNWGRFTGAGQRFSASLRAGAERKDFRISLVEPWFMGKKFKLGGELYYRDLLYLSDEYDQTNAGASIWLGKQVGRRARIEGRYRFEKIEIDVESDVPLGSDFNEEEGTYTKSALSFNYIYDSRDSNKLPRKGEKIDVGVTLAGGALGGDVDTYTVTGTGTKHWNLSWDTILTARGSFSVVDEYSGDGTAPIFERQFLGGSRDLRGFEYRDLGPRDPVTNEVLGGGTSAFVSLELTFPITERVRGAVFYDTGFVNVDSWDFGGGNLASDAGLGLRMDLPIGPIAVDYAIPLSTPDDEADNGGQFNFYLNYQF